MSRDRKTDMAPAPYASPPCLMHEVDPAYVGVDPTPGRQRRGDSLLDAQKSPDGIAPPRSDAKGPLRGATRPDFRHHGA